MQISKLSTQTFGCRKYNNINQNQRQCEYRECQTPKSVTITRNALIAGLVGLLANCSSETYTLSTTPEGNPIIYNQDGDSIDFLPESIREEYESIYGMQEDYTNSDCELAQ